MTERNPTVPDHFANIRPDAPAAFKVFEELSELMGWYNAPNHTPTNGPKDMEARTAAFEKLLMPTRVRNTDGWRQQANRTQFPFSPPEEGKKPTGELALRKAKFDTNIVVHDGIWNVKPGQYNSFNLIDVMGRFDGFEGKICRFKRSNARIAVVRLPEGKNAIGVLVSKNLKVQMKLCGITMMTNDLAVFYTLEQDEEGKYKVSEIHEANGSTDENIENVRKELGWPSTTFEDIIPDWLN